MNTKVTLQEKLRDLRDERKMTLSDLAGATGIPLSTLQRMEGRDDIRVGYQDVAALAQFYNVSTDYLFGLTDNRQFRHIEIDALHLSDEAVETLKDERLNNRLVSELLAHPDFVRLMQAVEIYIDRKVLPQISGMNAVYQAAQDTIQERFDGGDNDEIIAYLQEAMIDEDDYLRHRISERFNDLMKSLFAAHKKDPLPAEQSATVEEIKEQMQTYLDTQKTESAQRAKAVVLCKQLGLNAAKLTDEEWRVLMKVLERSEKFKQGRRRR